MNKCFFILCIILFAGCKKISEFRVSDSANITIPQTVSVGTPFAATTPVTTSTSYELEAQGGDIKHVKEIKLEKLTMTITDPPAKTFGFLNSIHISILADGLPEKEIAYLDNISSSVGNSIELITNGEVLDEYIKKDNYELKVKTVTDEIITQSVTIKTDMTFFVRAKIL